MPSRYLRELSGLNGAYRAALEIDVGPLCATIERWAARPMLMVGSGGSFSTATFAADLHEYATGQLARATTPLEVISKPERDSGLVCFSASGRNQDIVAAFRVAATREMEPLSALVLERHSPLGEMGRKFGYADVVCMGHRTFKDGFLAVASLIGCCVLLSRAYRAVFGRTEKDLPKGVVELVRQATSFVGLEEIGIDADRAIRGRDYVSVLYSSELAVAAVDLESRFVEAALGALHIADLRNFGHGRHFWIARKARETAVVALISEKQEELGTRTVSLLPEEVATLAVHFSGSNDVQALAGLVIGLFVAASAAQLARIDPGKPGVPAFGRRLYHLKPKLARPKQALLNRAAALRRKGVRTDDGQWIAHYEQALETVNSSRYQAVVLDYDGTLCDARDRAGPLGTAIADELRRLIEEGALVGLATGRGPSAAIELRASLPRRLHDRVLVGYYNGAEIRRLTDEEDPVVESDCEESSLVTALTNDPMLSGTVRSNSVQISIGVSRGVKVEDGAGEVNLLMRANGVDGEVVTSAHSIDVCLVGQSKKHLLKAMRETFGFGEGAILRIGDHGRPPGNDWKLLDDPHGLSVDEVSSHPLHCWSLTPAGSKGTQACLHYLKRLGWTRRGGRLRLSGSGRA